MLSNFSKDCTGCVICIYFFAIMPTITRIKAIAAAILTKQVIENSNSHKWELFKAAWLEKAAGSEKAAELKKSNFNWSDKKWSV